MQERFCCSGFFLTSGSCLGPLAGLAKAPGPLVPGPLVLRLPNFLRSFFSLAAGRPGREPQAAARKNVGVGLANEIYDEY